MAEELIPGEQEEVEMDSGSLEEILDSPFKLILTEVAETHERVPGSFLDINYPFDGKVYHIRIRVEEVFTIH